VTVLPMFPLGSVLFPGAVLPLHVFEPRYRQLVQDCLANDAHEFGVVLIQRGSEVGGGDVRGDFGVVARMVQVAEMPDGRYAVVSVGTRRIRVNAWLPDDPYPLADIDDWPDAAAEAGGVWNTERVASLTQRVRRCSALALELGDHAGDPNGDVDDDIGLASYQLCSLAPLSTHDDYRLLAAASPQERLSLLETMLDDLEAMLHFRLHADGPIEDPSA
jgi:Lon protease-like protein